MNKEKRDVNNVTKLVERWHQHRWHSEDSGHEVEGKNRKKK